MLLARRCEAELLLVRTVFPEGLPEGAPRFEATHEAQDYLMSIAKYLHEEDLVARTVVLPLEAAEGIIDEAAFSDVDLIVMVTHGRRGVDALLHPSVTWHVLRQANAPILVCKCASDDAPAALMLHLPRFMTNPQVPILVALDGSLQAEEALPIAADLARTFGNPLLLVRAGEPPFLAGGVSGAEPLVGQAWAWSLEEAENYLKRKAAELASTGLKVQMKTAVERAVPFIQQVAEEREVGLIIIASHGHGWLGRLALGSVASRILQEVEIPILLVHMQPLSPNEEHPSPAPKTMAKHTALP